jgi:hypothetical protein
MAGARASTTGLRSPPPDARSPRRGRCRRGEPPPDLTTSHHQEAPFVELDEPLYALAFLWLFFSGPDWVSLDHLLVDAREAQRAIAAGLT